jgi:hypothetical protein
MDFEHAVQAWTVGQLRDALAGLPDDLPIIVDVAEEPGGDTVQEQVVVHAGFGHGVDGRGEPFVGRDFRIGCEFPSGTSLQRDR